METKVMGANGWESWGNSTHTMENAALFSLNVRYSAVKACIVTTSQNTSLINVIKDPFLVNIAAMKPLLTRLSTIIGQIVSAIQNFALIYVLLKR